MDKSTQKGDTPPPMYRYRASVWIERSMEVMAEDDEAMENAVFDKLESEGTSARRVVRIETKRTIVPWD